MTNQTNETKQNGRESGLPDTACPCRWTFVVEFDLSNDHSYPAWPWWKPGIFRSRLGGKPYRRVWWACFALAWWQGNAKEYGEAVKCGVWIN